MQKLAGQIDRISELTGRAVSWLALAMVVMTFFNVMQRYLMNSGLPWEQELVRFMHAILFLAAAGYTLKYDEHVRVDVFYHRFSARGRAWVDLLGTLLFLYPVCAAILYFSWEYVLSSWALLEASSEFRGMPGVFLLKTFIWFFAVALMLQGAALLLRAWAVLRGQGGEAPHG